jgi:competence protein ComEA
VPPAETEPRAPARRRLGAGAVVVVVLVALAATVGIGILRTQGGGGEQTIAVSPTATPHAGDLYVHVSGAVRAPGLYMLPYGSRVMDAVAAAGGFARDAVRDGVNLAQVLGDGEQLAVPHKGAARGATGSSPAAAGGKINLNTADEAALDTLPRIGPAMAQRIIAWRTQHGRFTSVEDLLAVPGIGDKMLEALRDLVTV